jgi:hypothetical protein
VRRSVAASSQPSTCAGLRAPTMAAVTAGHAKVHATATLATLVPWRVAIGRIAFATARLRARPSPVKSGEPERQSSLGRDVARSAGKGSRQQPGRHGAVDDHAGVVRAAPRQLCCRHVAVDCRERRLQRVDMSQPLGRFELRGIMIRKTDCTHLPLGLQVEQRLPVLFKPRAILRRPVHLVEIDPLGSKPAQGGDDLGANAGGGADLLGHDHAIGFVPGQPTFREDKRSFAHRHVRQCLSDDFLGMSEAIHGGCIDPIDPAINCVAD